MGSGGVHLVGNADPKSILLGLGIGLFVGFVLGYWFAKRHKSPETNVTGIMLLSITSTIIFVFMSYAFNREPSWLIAVAMLATGYGAKGGEIIQGLLERKK